MDYCNRSQDNLDCCNLLVLCLDHCHYPGRMED